jgi:hypothetical protein
MSLWGQGPKMVDHALLCVQFHASISRRDWFDFLCRINKKHHYSFLVLEFMLLVGTFLFKRQVLGSNLALKTY